MLSTDWFKEFNFQQGKGTGPNLKSKKGFISIIGNQTPEPPAVGMIIDKKTGSNLKPVILHQHRAAAKFA